MTRRIEMAPNQGNLFDGCSEPIDFGRFVADVPIQREMVIQPTDPLLEGDEPIGTTPGGQLMYKRDDISDMYEIDKKEIDFRTEMKPIFNKLCAEVLVMQAMGDKRPIFYIPKKTRISVEPRNLHSKPYQANTVSRFFVVRDDIITLGKSETRKIAYGLLPNFDRRISIRKVDDDFSDLRDQSVKVAKDRKIFIPKKYLKEERYFNLTEKKVLDDFDKFCECVKECDVVAEKAKQLRKR